ncbi:MAG: SDR family NAD(P)-dependent oxidoreductase, partial [Trebonia sp.]
MRIEAGRVTVVTGGAGGIGYALAVAAASRGQRVVLSDVRADAMDAAADRLRESGAVVTTVVADVSQPADIDRLAQAAFALGSVQLICSNAGIVVLGRAWELTAADWDRVMNVNFMATVHLVRAFVPRLLEAGRPARLSGGGASVTAVVADVSRPDDIERVARAAFRLGRVQLVCSNAGIVRHGRAWEVPAADWERVIGVNFMATVHLVRAFVPRLLEAGEPAQLLVTGSMASVTARAGISPYVAAKHALLGLCESLNQE